MSLRFLDPVYILMLVLVLMTGCNREQRQFPQPTDGSLKETVQRQSPLQPAEARPTESKSSSSATVQILMPEDYWEKYEGNAYAASQGKRLYRWYNCNGCHAAGGGGMGPALMDDKWLYGGEPDRIYATITEGRPNGMPSFAGHIPEDQLWQIVTYVRSMSGQLRTDVAPNRADSLHPHEPESRRKRQPIRDTRNGSTQ